jgi:hypothetical protein
MFFTVYITTNLINKKYYFGKHQTNNLEDNYLGSGIALTRAIKKYGKENFKKEILFIFDNERDMYLKEIELITENVVNDSMSYNINFGGEGGMHSKQTKEKISKSHLGKVCSPEHTKKLSEVLKRASKISGEKRALKWAIQFPDGTMQIVKGLKTFCKINNINSGNMFEVANGNRKQHKGFKVSKYEDSTCAHI